MSLFKLSDFFKSYRYAVISVFALSMPNAYAIADKAPPPSDIIIQNAVKQDVSKPLRDVPITSEESLFLRPFKILTSKHIPISSPSLETISVADTDLERPTKTNLVPVNIFQGIGVGLGNYQPRFAPADATGAAGLTQYVQTVNADFAVFNKQSGQIVSGFPKPNNALFSGFGGLCENTNNGSAVIKYDQLADRWVFTQYAFADIVNGPFMQCIAVSKTSDATGAYHRYAYQFNSFNDAGKLALWHDAYYMTFNMFGPTITGPRVCAFDRNAMLAGQSAAMQCKQLNFVTSGSLLPADLDGKTLPAAGTPEYLLTLNPPANLKLFKFTVDFANSANTKITGPFLIPVPNFTISCPKKTGDACIPQLNSTTKLDTMSDRLMNRLAYRQLANNGSMVVTHTIAGGGGGGNSLRWYEVIFNNGTTDPILNRRGTLGMQGDMNGFIGSIAMDKLGNLALGYTISSQTKLPTISLSTRLITDNVFDNPQPLVVSTGSQIDGLTRWGDYNNMAIDPVDDCTFWYTNQYLKTTGTFNWSTLISSFKLAGC